VDPRGFDCLAFPKSDSAPRYWKVARSLLRATQLAVLGLCGVATIVMFLSGPSVMRLSFGEKYMALAHLLGLYGLAMTLYALISLWFYYYLAMEKATYVWVLTAGIVLQASILSIFTSNSREIVVGMIICGTALTIIGEIMFHAHNSDKPLRPMVGL
jgi:O-antigen/teichoic acid export membrane protein